jgi:hypothetical protein
MTNLPLSVAAAGLLRALLARAGPNRNRILLIGFDSTEWQSLIFIGERHKIQLRVTGSDAGRIASVLMKGIESVEFAIPGHLVADINTAGPLCQNNDGSVTVNLEALTIAE